MVFLLYYGPEMDIILYNQFIVLLLLENIIEFNGFDRPSEQFLRFAKDICPMVKQTKIIILHLNHACLEFQIQ